MRQTSDGNDDKNNSNLASFLQKDYSFQATKNWKPINLIDHPLARWVELNLGLEKEDGLSNGKWVRCKPKTLHEASLRLAKETNLPNKRWTGEHDCKNYLMNYKEALAHNKLSSHQDIRFFLDVPKEVKLRRKLEQQLIYLWLPPFNKETRDRWATTFTNN